MTRRGPDTRSRAGAADRPALASNFLVDFGDGLAGRSAAGFSEVIFPEFRIAPGAVGHPASSDTVSSKAPGATRTLILRRGICGALDLYCWWDQARNGKNPRKSVRIQLLSQDQTTVVLTWTFHKAHPVALTYAPLRALESEVAMESIELAFEGFEVS